MNSIAQNRVILIGLDGADFKIIDYLISRGKLPSISRLVQKGSRATLQSLIHPVSAPAWVSLYTGKNPGKHGVVDFVRRKKGSYDIEPINRYYVTEKPIWTILTEFGKRVCVYNVPITYPPDVVNGIIVSGMDSPSVNKDFTYPVEFKKELINRFPGYDFDKSVNFFVNKTSSDPTGDNLRNLEAFLRMQLDVIEYLLGLENWDFFFGVVSTIDRAQHFAWRYVEDYIKGISQSQRKRAYAESVFRYYELIDERFQRLLGSVGDETTIMLVSDHGFTTLEKLVSPRNLLRESGFLNYRVSFPTYFVKGLRRLAWNYTPVSLRKCAVKLLAINFIKTKSLSPIDWDNTRIYPWGGTIGMQLSANLRGREPFGIVPVNKHGVTLKNVIKAISKLKTPDEGKAVVDGVYTKEELYHGQCMGDLPDLFVVMQGYTYRPRDDDGGDNRIFSDPSEEWGGLYTGTHRREGIFLTSGSCIRHCKIQQVSLFDITPTILYLLGLPLFQDFDGRVLTECIEKSYLISRDIQWKKPSVENHQKRDYKFDNEEEDAIKKRLKALGYL